MENIEIVHRQHHTVIQVGGLTIGGTLSGNINRALMELFSKKYFINSHCIFFINGNAWLSIVYSEPSVIQPTKPKENEHTEN